jgi:hypothetical protein
MSRDGASGVRGAQHAEPTQAATLVDDLLDERTEEASIPSGVLLADVLRSDPAVVAGRVLVAWREVGRDHQAWVSQARGAAARPGDRVLLAVPRNEPESFVLAIVSGASARPLAPTAASRSLVLRPGESLRVVGADGRDLFEAVGSESGPVLRLTDPDLGIQVAGRLRIEASAVEIAATGGSVRIGATDDVAVAGERVLLNSE